ncbi:MAG: M15 family metallopeptidase [Lachnospiraceae bacterium]|nr:M15 family metallopeptidase [Lachnospiraceae bacterium]
MIEQVIMEREKIYNGNLLLVNARYPLKNTGKERKEGLVPACLHFPAILLKRDAANILQMVLEKISPGRLIVPVSGYRTQKEQEDIYNSSLRDNGEEFTKKYVALPCHSEHQTGLAIDLGIYKEKIDFIRPDFPYTGICNKFRKAAPAYGFIERYQKDKEEITGISHEPWHFRYVGYPHSRIITDNNFSLEEYIEFIKNYTENNRLVYKDKCNATIQIYYVPAEDQTVINLPARYTSQVSGNNTDGFIVTIWRKS